MQHHEDQGEAFGRWPNKTARLMYHDIMPLALNGIDTSGSVADLGGANGLTKEWIPHAVTVDYDKSKRPDILADILTYRGEHDLLILRYVLHYMPDTVVRDLMRHLASYHKGKVLVIQFTNDDLPAKYANSVGETKWFRTTAGTLQLLSKHWQVREIKSINYKVEADFYRERLNHPDPSAHRETVLVVELEQ